MPSLLAALIDQYRSPQSRFNVAPLATALIETGELPGDAVRQFGDGYSAVASSFGYALAGAAGEQAAQALANGLSLEDVGQRLGGLFVLGNPGLIAYALDTFFAEVARPGMPSLAAYVQRADQKGLDMTTEAKTVLLKAMSNHKDITKEQMAVLSTTGSGFDKITDHYNFSQHRQVMDAARGENAAPMLDLMRHEVGPMATTLATTYASTGALPKKESMLYTFHERVLDSTVHTASKYAFVEALVAQAVQRLEEGQSITKVGSLVAAGTKALGDAETLAYGTDLLRTMIVHSDHPTLRAMVRSDGKDLSSEAKQAWVDGAKPALSERGSQFLIEVLSNSDKLSMPGGLDIFRHAVDAAFPPAPSLSAPAVTTSTDVVVDEPKNNTVLSDPELVRLYGDAPQDAAFQALTDRLVSVAIRHRENPGNAPTRFATLGGMVGLAHEMNALSINATVHLANRVMGALSPDAEATFDERQAFLHGMNDTGFLKKDLQTTLAERFSGIDQFRSTNQRPRLGR